MFNAVATPQTTMIVIWVIVVVLGFVIEEFTSSLVSIWFSVAALISLVFAIANFSVYIQLAVFAVLVVILILASRPLAKKLMMNTEVKTNADKLCGMIGIVTKTIKPDEKGNVKVDYQEWTAISFKNKLIEENTKVVIKGISGNKLIVDEIEEIEIK